MCIVQKPPWPDTVSFVNQLVVVVVMMSPLGTAYVGGQRCPEEMRNSTRLWIWRDPSLSRDSWQPFYWLGHHSRAAVVARSWRIVDHCQTVDVEGCRHCQAAVGSPTFHKWASATQWPYCITMCVSMAGCGLMDFSGTRTETFAVSHRRTTTKTMPRGTATPRSRCDRSFSAKLTLFVLLYIHVETLLCCKHCLIEVWRLCVQFNSVFLQQSIVRVKVERELRLDRN